MSASAIATPLAARAGFAPASSRDVVGAGEKLRGPSVSGSARVATRPPGARLHRARRRGTVAAEAYGESDQRGNWWKPQSGQPRVSPPRRPPPTNLAALSRGGQIFDDPKHQSAPAARRALREISGQTRAAVCSLGAPASKRKDSAGRSVFERSGGFVYIRNFFSRRDFEVIQKECEALHERVGAERRACAHQRLGVMVPPENVVHRAFMNHRVAERISELVGQTLFPADVPVEYRVYPQGSAMDWHQDVALYVEPQYELVFTLDNTSDSQTQWQDEDGHRRGGWTEPNSIIMVRAEDVVHRVTPINAGERSIIKFVYTTTMDKTAEYYDNLLTYS